MMKSQTTYCIASILTFLPVCGSAGELPSVTEIVAAQRQLRLAVQSIQGEMTAFRKESPQWGVMDQTTADAELPLKLKGRFWRSPERFRVDYTVPRDGRMEAGVAAMDSSQAWEFIVGNPEDPDNLGALTIYDLDVPAAILPKSFIEATFFDRFDSLWRNSRNSYADYLQRPDTRILDGNDDSLPGGFVIEVHHSGEKAEFQFTKDLAFGRLRVEQDQVILERRVFSVATPFGVVPQRIVEVADIEGGGGYTEVVNLQISVLPPNSPVSKELSVDSFRNYDTEFQVFRIDDDGEEIASRVFPDDEIPGAILTEPSTNDLRSWFLWVNGTLIVLVAVFLGLRSLAARRR